MNRGLSVRRGSKGQGFIVDNYQGGVPAGHVLVKKGNNRFTNMCRSKALTAGAIVYLYVNPLTKDRVS